MCARRTYKQHTCCPQQHTRQLVAQSQRHAANAATTQRLHMCMCAAVQRSDTCTAAGGKSDLLLLAAQQRAAALVAEGTWLAGSDTCSQLCVLMPQVRSDSSARVAGVGLLQRCSSTVRSTCVSRPGGGGEDGGVQAGCNRRAGTDGQAAGGPWGGRRSLWRDVDSR
jgi:hypothetical protein